MALLRPVTAPLGSHISFQLLRSSSTLADLHEGATDEIYNHISAAADAYHDASVGAPTSSSSAAHHARFLKSLITNDIFRAKERLQQQQQSRTTETRAASEYLRTCLISLIAYG